MNSQAEIEKHRGTSIEGHFDSPSDQHQFVIGDRAFRANYGVVEQGVVIRVERINLDSQGRSRGASPDGEYIETTARFGHSYESQTYCWKFFPRVEGAFKKLAEQQESEIKDLERKIAKARSIINMANAGVATVTRYDKSGRQLVDES